MTIGFSQIKTVGVGCGGEYLWSQLLRRLRQEDYWSPEVGGQPRLKQTNKQPQTKNKRTDQGAACIMIYIELYLTIVHFLV